MAGNRIELPEEARADIQRRRSANEPWRSIAASYHVSRLGLRCWFDPHYRAERKAVDAAAAERRRTDGRLRRGGAKTDAGQRVSEALDPVPTFVLAERTRRQALQHASLTAYVLGDPLPGYSALDRRAA